jgi:sulfite reductase (NADPH) flavoprotein alpha-component
MTTPIADRQYSIASIPQDGAIHLVVRQVKHEGALGLASGWLTEHAQSGNAILLRLRSNPNFHLPDNDRPLILIGNGTGIAGLRSHLKTRAANGRKRNWLIFGERNAAYDYPFCNEIEAWREQRVLERVDLAFSRDQAERVYVQDRLRAAADELRAWLADGATILVCGSLEGMAPGVDAVLTEVCGSAALEQLTIDGRYRRDVY